MQSVALLALLVSCVSAGNLFNAGYGYQAAPVYTQQVYSAPVVAKTIVPAAQSYAYNNRAPAARLAVPVAAAPVAYSTPLAYNAAPVYSAPAVVKTFAPAVQTYAQPIAVAKTVAAVPTYHAHFDSPLVHYAY